MAKYLIEGDNSEKFVIFNQDKFCNSAIVKNLFLELFDEYNIYSEDELEYYLQDLVDVRLL